MRLASNQAAAGSTPTGSHQEEVRMPAIVRRHGFVLRQMRD
jgi:hypothetical protein